MNLKIYTYFGMIHMALGCSTRQRCEEFTQQSSIRAHYRAYFVVEILRYYIHDLVFEILCNIVLGIINENHRLKIF